MAYISLLGCLFRCVIVFLEGEDEFDWSSGKFSAAAARSAKNLSNSLLVKESASVLADCWN